MSYHVKIEKFEGPLDLLLHLIEKAKVDIKDIFISEVTEQYIAYLNQMKYMDMDIASEFLVMAADLIVIKSRSLLPKEKEITEMEEDMKDSEQALIQRLIEYKRYKEVSDNLRVREEVYSKVYYKLPEEISFPTNNVILTGLNLDGLISAFEKVLRQHEKESKKGYVQEIVRDRFTIQEKIMHTRLLLKKNSFILFEDMFHPEALREEVVISFIALLELLKMNEIVIEQKYIFSPIFIRAKEKREIMILAE